MTKIQEKTNPYEKPVLIIKSHLQKWIKEHGMRNHNLTARAVNDAVVELLEKAIVRTKLSRMKTICPKHI